MIKHYKTNRQKRKKRVRTKISGDAKRPRLAVFRSNRYISAQLIDDTHGKTLVCVHSKFQMPGNKSPSEGGENKTARAQLVGMELAKRAKDLGIKNVVFDRSGYRYHGRVRALAEGVREGGLKI